MEHNMYSNQKKQYASQFEEFADKQDWNQEYTKQCSKYQKVKQRIEKLIQLKQKLKQKAKIDKNIKQYKDGCKKIFSQYLSLLDFDNFKNAIAKPKGVKYYLIFGAISVGKSSLINYFFNTSQSVGIGETTSKPRVIKKIQNRKGETIYIWDTPGKNQSFNILSSQMLKYFASADKIFLLSQTGTKSILQMATVIQRLNSNILYFIRTKCDDWTEKHRYTLDKYKQIDKENLLQAGILCQAYYQVGSLQEKQNTNNLNKFENRSVKQELYD